MTKNILKNLLNFFKKYFTFIFVFIIFIINYIILYKIINYKYNKDNDKILTIEDYLYKSLQVQYINNVITIFLILPLIFYMIYKLVAKKENVKIIELIFIFSFISGIYKFFKSIIIIYNNYYKAQIITYGAGIDIVPRINSIYKCLISSNEYSNAEILYNIWSGPIIFAILFIFLQIFITYIINQNNFYNTNIIQLLFKKDQISFNTITIGDVINLFEVLNNNNFSIQKLKNKLI